MKVFFKKRAIVIFIFLITLLFIILSANQFFYAKNKTNNIKTGSCGDGICQNITCQAIGCPQPETPQNCPQDCKKITTPTIQNTKEKSCIDSGGKVITSLCCKTVIDFPNTCVIGACGCGPDDSYQIKTCQCPDGQCFDGEKCNNILTGQQCRPTNRQCLTVEIEEVYYYYDQSLNRCFELKALCNGSRFNNIEECKKSCEIVYPTPTKFPTKTPCRYDTDCPTRQGCFLYQCINSVCQKLNICTN